jgi:hypothetical protein
VLINGRTAFLELMRDLLEADAGLVDLARRRA